MARPKAKDNQGWSASQVVAHNLTRAREVRGLTQSEVAERLTRFSGSNWSQVTVAQAEASVAGQRVRQFTANELVALARTFDLPVLFFFLPPDDGSGRFLTDDAKGGLPWEYLLVLLLGHQHSFSILADRFANWTRLLSNKINIPLFDVLADADAIRADMAGHLSRRIPLLPEDVLAAAFHGLAARRIRGAKPPGDDVAKFAENLRGLADALIAFNNYRPGQFVDERVVEDIAERRHEEERRFRAAIAEHAAEDEDD